MRHPWPAHTRRQPRNPQLLHAARADASAPLIAALRANPVEWTPPFPPRPPRNDAKGLAVAAAVIGTWALLFRHAMWGISLAPGAGRSPWWDIVGTFFALEFASAGLFITTHGGHCCRRHCARAGRGARPPAPMAAALGVAMRRRGRGSGGRRAPPCPRCRL
jgi:hypothetical protein